MLCYMIKAILLTARTHYVHHCLHLGIVTSLRGTLLNFYKAIIVVGQRC